jgi:4-hydroxy-3-methylbut-2-en-1-yl diphosphate reductase
VSTELRFLTALRLEALAIKVGAPRAHVRAFGMGNDAAKVAVARLLRDSSEPVALLGVSGALNASLSPGAVVVATELGFVGNDETVPIAAAGEIAEQLERRGVSVVTGPITTAPRIVAGNEAREKAAAGGAVAVDMESWFFSPLARAGRLIVIRTIIDVPGREVISTSTPVAAWHAATALARVARAVDETETLFATDTRHEQAGES